MARVLAKGQAVLLGGLVAATALCACLSLVASALLIPALLYLISQDDHRADRSDWILLVFLGAALAASIVVATRVGWRVGQDWYCKGR